MKAISNENGLLKFQGSNFLKQRLILSILSGKSVHIVDIRSHDESPGLRGYEVSLIRLFDKISNGSEIDINKSGTAVSIKPGILHGGVIHHDCNLERGIGKIKLQSKIKFNVIHYGFSFQVIIWMFFWRSVHSVKIQSMRLFEESQTAKTVHPLIISKVPHCPIF